MRKIPEPLYQQVLEISLALTNATEAGNASAGRGAYPRLWSFAHPAYALAGQRTRHLLHPSILTQP